MLNKLRGLFKQTPDTRDEVNPSLAAAVLMFEVVWADHDIDEQELTIMSLQLQRQFQLSQEQVEEVIAETRANHNASVGVFEFTRALNEQLDQEEKYQVLVAMWSIAMADHHIDAFEEHTVRRIADLLYVPHQRFIAAKQAARDKSRHPD